MTVQTQSFTQILTGFATAVQGTASVLVNFVIGSILRAIGEGTAWVSLWLQGLILNAIALTRAATSSGSDLDSWFAQFSFTRLAPTAASGQVTFSRFTPTFQAIIPTGTIVQTGSVAGSQQYQTVADTTNPAYSATLGGIVIPAGVASVTCTVVGITPGSNSLNLPDASGNVSEGAISQLYQPVQYVDTVTNDLAFDNGENAESDAAARIRFAGWLGSLARATLAAIGSAITALGSNFTYSITQNVNYAGQTQLGYFYVVVNDGTGAPSSNTLATVYSAIDAVRAFTVTFGVFAPNQVIVPVSMSITTLSTGAQHAATCATVQAAIEAYIQSLTMGQTLYYFKLGQIAIDASSDVVSVEAYTLNGGTVDITTTNQQVVMPGAITVL